MPTYNLLNNDTGEEFEEFMSYSALEQYLNDNPHVTQQLSAPSIVSGVPNKPDNGFRDLLKNMKKANSKGFRAANINTF